MDGAQLRKFVRPGQQDRAPTTIEVLESRAAYEGERAFAEEGACVSVGVDVRAASLLTSFHTRPGLGIEPSIWRGFPAGNVDSEMRKRVERRERSPSTRTVKEVMLLSTADKPTIGTSGAAGKNEWRTFLRHAGSAWLLFTPPPPLFHYSSNTTEG